VLNDKFIIKPEEIANLISSLDKRGYKVIGPTLRDGAIVYDDISSANNLPVGYTDDQNAGTYRIKKRNDNAIFGYSLGPQSWKKYLSPPREKLWSATRSSGGFTVDTSEPAPDKMAFMGVRPCELSSIKILDRIYTEGEQIDPHYMQRRRAIFVIAVNCSVAGGTCFCVSMGAGPRADSGYDIALTEVINDKDHYFVAEIGSKAGASVTDGLHIHQVSDEQIRAAEQIIANTAQSMGRRLDTDGLKESLYNNYANPQWEKVAQKCLACANCTMVCPTCFCSSVEDITDISGERSERWEAWDSCFTMDFSYIHGGSVRSSTMSRYRHWMTHKLATWIDQFGTFGCVGCGRCITWCPVGIDITEQAAAIRKGER